MFPFLILWKLPPTEGNFCLRLKKITSYSGFVIKIHVNRRHTKKKILLIIEGNDHYKYVHAPGLSILVLYGIILDIAAWYIFSLWLKLLQTWWLLLALSKAAFITFSQTRTHTHTKKTSMKRLHTEKKKTEIHGWHINTVFLFGGHWCSNITGMLWQRQIHIHDLLHTFEVDLQHHCATVTDTLLLNCNVIYYNVCQK